MKKIFSFKRVVVQVGWAKSGTWGVTEGDTRRTYLMSFHIIRRDDIPAISIIIGPLAIVAGLSA